MTEEYIVTFSAHFDAILANRTLGSAGLEVQLMPVPRAVASGCGTCVRFQAEALPALLAAMEVEGIYRRAGEGWEKLNVAECLSGAEAAPQLEV